MGKHRARQRPPKEWGKFPGSKVILFIWIIIPLLLLFPVYFLPPPGAGADPYKTPETDPSVSVSRDTYGTEEHGNNSAGDGTGGQPQENQENKPDAETGNPLNTDKKTKPPQNTWESYRDPERTKKCNVFNKRHNTVYMKGTCFTPNHQYKIAYYDGNIDGNGHLVQVNTFPADNSGVLDKSYYPFPHDPIAEPGKWHAVVFEGGVDAPHTYNKAKQDNQILKDDAFQVHDNAIPEFSSVTGAIGTGGACGLAYILLRRKRCLDGAA